MSDDPLPPAVQELRHAAAGFDALAETSDLMGDHHGAAAWRERASHARLCAMAILDRSGSV